MGRDPELLEIVGLLAKPDCRLLAVHGAGGVGKSRLALQAAGDLLQGEAFNDGIFFVGLEAVTQPDLIASSIADAVGIDLQGQLDPLERVMAFVGERSLLLVLDNFERLTEAATIPVELLQACPNLKLLVTSREWLNVEEEWVLSLDGLPFPGEGVIDLEDARASDSVQLFLRRAKRARLDFSPQREDVSEVVGICRQLGGSPLQRFSQ